MKQISLLSELKETVAGFKKAHENTVTNFHAMLNSLNGYIERGMLYCDEYEEGILFYIDQGRFYNMIYYWDTDLAFPPLNRDKKLLIEEMLPANRKDAAAEIKQKMMADQGFVFAKENLQTQVNLKEWAPRYEELLQEKMPAFEKEGYRAEICSDEQTYQEAVTLWETYLEDIDIPNEHMTSEEGSKVLVVLDQAGKVIAATWWKIEGRVCESRHTVVDKGHLRKGIATILMLIKYLDSYQSGATRMLGWVATTNMKSIAMQKNLGVLPNGNVSYQYILEKQ